MKRLMTIAAVGFAACTVVGDAEFDKLVALAETPTNQIKTVEQAKAVLKACCAVTNNYLAFNVTKLNLVPAAEVKDILRSTKTLWWTSILFANDTYDAEFAKDAIDIALKSYKAIDKSTDNGSARRSAIRDHMLWHVLNFVYDENADKRNEKTNPNYHHERFSYVEDKYLAQKAQECLDAGYPELAVMFGLQLGEYSSFSTPARLAWTASKKAELKEFAKKASVNDKIDVDEYFTVLRYFLEVGNDPESANDIFRADMFASQYAQFYYARLDMNHDAAFLQKACDAYLSSPAGTHPDTDLVKVALSADRKLGNKKTTASIFDKIMSKQQKLSTALYLDDVDKIIDCLKDISDKLDAKTITQVITVLNGIDVDYRVEDVKKILRNINKKYTAKLYDDRDTWEPILSKVRALLEVL